MPWRTSGATVRRSWPPLLVRGFTALLRPRRVLVPWPSCARSKADEPYANPMGPFCIARCRRPGERSLALWKPGSGRCRGSACGRWRRSCGVVCWRTGRVGALRWLRSGRRGGVLLQGTRVLPVLRGGADVGTAACLCDAVIPEVPVRHWVLSLLYRVRTPCAYDTEVARAPPCLEPAHRHPSRSDRRAVTALSRCRRDEER